MKERRFLIAVKVCFGLCFTHVPAKIDCKVMLLV